MILIATDYTSERWKLRLERDPFSLADFRAAVTVIDPTLALELRSRYIRKFIDTEIDYYQTNILKRRKFSDGVCYTGYLWNCLLPSRRRISAKRFWTKIRRKDELIAFWDIHSCDHIFVWDYWKFPKDAVLKVSSRLLFEHKWIVSHYGYLPEDIYFCDETFEWSLIATHESDAKGDIYVEI